MGNNNKIQTPLVSSPNYGKQSKWLKFKRKLRTAIVNKIANTPLQFASYSSYWHYLFSKKSNIEDKNILVSSGHFLTQKPNFGAGIGHQLANWNAGLYFSRYFNVKFAHSPFSTEKWEEFFGFGEGEVHVDKLDLNEYKIVGLPKFDSTSLKQINLIGKIIMSYTGRNTLFTLELDQGYMRQCDTSGIIQEKFFNAVSRKMDKLIFSRSSFNIAIHIRRRMKIESTEVWENRGLNNIYFSNVLRQVVEIIKQDQKVEIYLFSQGTKEEFPEFNDFENMHYCMDMGPIDSFLHMVNADLLISSKSSFSYKPALISKKMQIVPETFWHSYPDTDQYILADNNGNFNIENLKNKLV